VMTMTIYLARYGIWNSLSVAGVISVVNGERCDVCVVTTGHTHGARMKRSGIHKLGMPR
jgi:hypothetical protein